MVPVKSKLNRARSAEPAVYGHGAMNPCRHEDDIAAMLAGKKGKD
jgi:hypothetical protein